MWETWVRSLGQEDPLEKEMATHSSILAWAIPWTEKLGGPSSWGRKESDTTEWLHFLSFFLSCRTNWKAVARISAFHKTQLIFSGLSWEWRLVKKYKALKVLVPGQWFDKRWCFLLALSSTPTTSTGNQSHTWDANCWENVCFATQEGDTSAGNAAWKLMWTMFPCFFLMKK